MSDIVYGPRFREATVEKHAKTHWVEVNQRTGQIVRDLSTDYCSRKTSTFMHDVVVENFRSRKAAGEIINNPMDKTTEEVIYYPASGCITDSADANNVLQLSSSQVYYTSYTELPPVPAVDIQAFQNRAVTEAYARANSKEIQSLVSLAELKETKDMFISAVSKLYSVNKHLRNWDYLARKFSIKDARDAWMEVRFGWRPFVSEVKAYLTLSNKVLIESPKRQTFRETVPLPLVQESSVTEKTVYSQKVTYARYATISGRVSAGVLCNQRYAGFPDTYGLWDIPGTVWELTKLSWFVDYFFDVGKVIASWTPDTLWAPLTSWVVIRIDTLQMLTMSGFEFTDPRYTGYLSGETLRRRVKSIQRIPCPPRKVIPQFLPKLSWAKYVDAVSVGSQMWEKTKSILRVNASRRRY